MDTGVFERTTGQTGPERGGADASVASADFCSNRRFISARSEVVTRVQDVGQLFLPLSLASSSLRVWQEREKGFSQTSAVRSLSAQWPTDPIDC